MKNRAAVESLSTQAPSGRRHRPDRIRSARVECLEGRTLLATSATLAVNNWATLTVSEVRETLVFTNVEGRISHGTLTAPAGQAYADEFDFDSSTPGSQGVLATSSSHIVVRGGEFDVTLGSATSSAESLSTPFSLDGSGSSTLTLDNSADPQGFVFLSGSAERGFFSYFPRTYPPGTPVTVHSVAGMGGGISVIGNPGANLFRMVIWLGNPVPTGGLAYRGGTGNSFSLDGNSLELPVNSVTTTPTRGGDTTVAVDGRPFTVEQLASISLTAYIPNGLVDLSVFDPNEVSIGPTTQPFSQFQVDAKFGMLAAPSVRIGRQREVTVALGPGNSAAKLDLTTDLGESVMTLLGGGGTDTLSIDATAGGVSITPGDIPGRVIIRKGSTTIIAEAFSSISVLSPPATLAGLTLPPATAGIPLVDVGVAEFVVPSFPGSNAPGNPTETAGRFGATIDWGDGTVSAGEISPLAPDRGTSTIRGTHTYPVAVADGPRVISVVLEQLEPTTRVVNGVPVAVTATTSQAQTSVQVNPAPLSIAATTLYATAGRELSSVVVARVTSANPLIASGQVPLNFGRIVIFWGDGSFSDGFAARNGGQYDIIGSHTYDAYGSFPVRVDVPSSEGGMSQIVQAYGAAVVADEPIRPGFMIDPNSSPDGTAGVRARFDAGTFSTDSLRSPADTYAATVDWGDGQTSPAFVSLVPGEFYVIQADHTYARPGVYTTTATIEHGPLPGGSTATVTLERVIAGSTLAPVAVPATTAAPGQSFAGRVGSFRSSNPLADPADYRATIDWGDGSPPSAGTLARGADGTFDVSGTHAYAPTGDANLRAYTIRSVVVEPFLDPTRRPQGMFEFTPSSITLDATISVAETAVPGVTTLAGILSPASDSGISASDGITNQNRPVFLGLTNPGAVVSLYAAAAGSASAPTLIGQAVADSSGAWSVTSSLLPDGSYTILASASLPGQAGATTAPIYPGSGPGLLVIDTVAPRVTDTRFLPLGGQVLTTFQDDRSGLAQAGLANPANYSFVRERTATGGRNPRNSPRFVVNGVATTANLDPAAAQVVGVSIDNGRTIPGGFFRYVVRAAGITDVAGNPLAGSFAGSFPTGGAPGSDFAAELISFRRRVLPVVPASASVANLTPSGQRKLASTIASVNAGRITPERAAARIAALPRRGAVAVPVAKAAKPTALVADRLLRRGASAGN